MTNKPFKKRVFDFWDAFVKEEPEIRSMIDNRADANSLVSFVGNILNIAFTDPYFQLGKSDDNKYELILTPEGDRARLLQLHYCVSLAPKSLKSIWNFYSSKPAKSKPGNSLQMYGESIVSEDVSIYYEKDKDRSKINIKVFSPKLMELEESKRYNMFFIFLDQFIGELYTMEYVGYIDFVEEPQNLQETNVAEFKRVIDRIIEENNWNKADDPLDMFMGYHLEPNENEGWQLGEDIYIGMTSCPLIINKFLQRDDSIFNSFKKDGVIFGYLFYENINVPQEKMISQRSEIEDRIREITEPQMIAFSIGSATGFHFSYIDFIIYDYEAFIKIAKEILLAYDFEEVGYSDFIFGKEPHWFR